MHAVMNIFCPECKAELGTHMFAGVKFCAMCFVKIRLAYLAASRKPYPKWDNSAAIVQAKDLRHGLVPEADL